MKFLVVLAAMCVAGASLAREDAPNLPPEPQVVRVLQEAPAIRAALAQRAVEEANRSRLEAGPYEWNLRLGGQRRIATPAGAAQERFQEWNGAVERPLRLPGKAALDDSLGAMGVEIAEVAVGDARHEVSRALLRHWFVWLRESVLHRQWQQQVDLLARQAKAVSRRQALGDASRLEQVQADAALAQAEAQRRQAESRERIAADVIRRYFPGLVLDARWPLAAPPALPGAADEWVAAVLEHSHELGVARGESRRAALQAERSRQDGTPDPTVGFAIGRERGGQENVIGAYISIPLPGQARSAAAEATMAYRRVVEAREAAIHQRIAAEAIAAYRAAADSVGAWSSAAAAAEHTRRSADMAEKAYALGEGSLGDLLLARRLSQDAELAALGLQLDALESRYRLLLDSHRLWDLD